MIGLLTGLLGGVGAKAAGIGANLLGPWRLYAELALAAALLAAVGTQTWRLHSAEASKAQAEAETAKTLSAWNAQVAEQTRLAFVESEKQRAEEKRRQDAQREIDHETQRLAARDRTDATSAADARVRLLERAANTVRAADRGEAGGHSAAAEVGPAGSIAVPLDLLGRATESIQRLAAAYDDARTAGLACEAQYDSLVSPLDQP